MNIINILFYSFVIFCLFSCFDDPNSSKDGQKTFFFDAKGYFEQEMARLDQEQSSIQKTIRKDSLEETKKITDINWENELNLFKESDINKASWVSKYQADTNRTASNQQQIIYTATDKDLKTQELQVFLTNEQVDSIAIRNRIANQVYTSQQLLTYSPRGGYSIQKTQDVVLFDKDKYQIKVAF